MSFTPRWYQPACVEAVFGRWETGDRGTLAWLGTGLGKTVIAAMVARRVIMQQSGRVLFIAHREDLLQGAYDAFKVEMPSALIHFELNVDRVSAYDIETARWDAVMGSIASIHRRLEKYPPDWFTHIIIDESHRAASQSYLKVIHHFPDAKLLYLTATPMRSDEKSLQGYTYDAEAKPNKDQRDLVALCCQNVAFKMNLGEAVKDGWLVEPIPCDVQVDVDWSKLKMKGGDYDKDQLDEIMKEDEPLHKVAIALEQRVKGRCGVVFMPGVASAVSLSNLLRTSYGIDAMALHGKTEKHLRRDIVRRAKSGDLECLVNCQVATEGFDSPYWEYLADCQPTRFKGRALQKIGRVVRPISGDLFRGIGGQEDRQARLDAIAASAKPKAMILDMVGNLGTVARPISSKEILIGELPHKDYGGQPKPRDADVKHVLARYQGMTIDEARQRASDELYMHEVLMQPRYAAKAEGEVKVMEFESFFAIPFVWKEKEAKKYRRPPPGMEATEKQKKFIVWQFRLQGRPKPTEEWLESLSKKQAGAVISGLKQGART